MEENSLCHRVHQAILAFSSNQPFTVDYLFLQLSQALESLGIHDLPERMMNDLSLHVVARHLCETPDRFKTLLYQLRNKYALIHVLKCFVSMSGFPIPSKVLVLFHKKKTLGVEWQQLMLEYSRSEDRMEKMIDLSESMKGLISEFPLDEGNNTDKCFEGNLDVLLKLLTDQLHPVTWKERKLIIEIITNLPTKITDLFSDLTLSPLRSMATSPLKIVTRGHDSLLWSDGIETPLNEDRVQSEQQQCLKFIIHNLPKQVYYLLSQFVYYVLNESSLTKHEDCYQILSVFVSEAIGNSSLRMEARCENMVSLIKVVDRAKEFQVFLWKPLEDMVLDHPEIVKNLRENRKHILECYFGKTSAVLTSVMGTAENDVVNTKLPAMEFNEQRSDSNQHDKFSGNECKLRPNEGSSSQKIPLNILLNQSISLPIQLIPTENDVDAQLTVSKQKSPRNVTNDLNQEMLEIAEQLHSQQLVESSAASSNLDDTMFQQYDMNRTISNNAESSTMFCHESATVVKKDVYKSKIINLFDPKILVSSSQHVQNQNKTPFQSSTSTAPTAAEERKVPKRRCIRRNTQPFQAHFQVVKTLELNDVSCQVQDMTISYNHHFLILSKKDKNNGNCLSFHNLSNLTHVMDVPFHCTVNGVTIQRNFNGSGQDALLCACDDRYIYKFSISEMKNGEMPSPLWKLSPKSGTSSRGGSSYAKTSSYQGLAVFHSSLDHSQSTVVVCDAASHIILELSCENGKVLNTFGGLSSAVKKDHFVQFNTPTFVDVLVSEDASMVVCEVFGNSGIKKITEYQDGKMDIQKLEVKTISRSGFVLDQANTNIIVADEIGKCIFVIGSNGKCVKTFAGGDTIKAPSCLCLNEDDGTLFVFDSGKSRIVVLK